MTKNDVYRFVARRIDGCTKADVQTVLDVYADFIRESLQDNPEDFIPFPGVGKFYVKRINAKSGVSNLTKQPFENPAHNVLRFAVYEKSSEI